jgi:ribosome-binding protein aMBF1 (putative translation factor)
METKKRRRLEAGGWRIGGAKDFLRLSAEEARLVELKVALGASLRTHRARKGMSQTALAGRLGSSQSRVAKMEAGDASVSLDLQIRALLALGATRKELASAVASRQHGGSG